MRRDQVQPNAEEISHPGLLLDRFAEWKPDKGSEPATLKAETFAQASKVALPQGYLQAFEQRKNGFETPPEDAQDAPQILTATFTVRGRMVVGLGLKGVVEAGMLLQHTWGVPMISGSALKGLAASTAHLLAEGEDWRKTTGAQHETLFGSVKKSGAILFHDAWFIPSSAPGAPCGIAPDIMTVHHPKYYQGKGPGEGMSMDMDSPTPIPFITATGKFLVVLEVTSRAPKGLLHDAYAILQKGFSDLGIGAKTSSGYGRGILLTEAEQFIGSFPDHLGEKTTSRAIDSLMEELRRHWNHIGDNDKEHLREQARHRGTGGRYPFGRNPRLLEHLQREYKWFFPNGPQNNAQGQEPRRAEHQDNWLKASIVKKKKKLCVRYKSQGKNPDERIANFTPNFENNLEEGMEVEINSKKNDAGKKPMRKLPD